MYSLKIYSLVDVDGEENKIPEGVKKNVVKNTKDKEFVDVLFNKTLITHRIKRIQSKLHKNGPYDVCKISLSCFDDKR